MSFLIIQNFKKNYLDFCLFLNSISSRNYSFDFFHQGLYRKPCFCKEHSIWMSLILILASKSEVSENSEGATDNVSSRYSILYFLHYYTFDFYRRCLNWKLYTFIWAVDQRILEFDPSFKILTSKIPENAISLIYLEMHIFTGLISFFRVSIERSTLREWDSFDYSFN